MRSTRVTNNRSLLWAAAAGVCLLALSGVIGCGGGFPSGAGGGRIAFERVSSSGSRIYLMNADGSQQQSLTSEGARSPAWSPDGRRIVFVEGTASGDTYHAQEIWMMWKDGSHARQLTSGPDGHPAWSPNGRTIAFEHGDGVNDAWVAPSPDGAISIWLMAANGSHQRPLTHPGSSTDTTPRWSPDGRTIVFTRSAGLNDDLYVIGADGKGLRRLTHLGGASSPAWSPKGQTIAFVDGSGGSGSSRTVVAVAADGKHLRALTPSGTDAIQPTWSPDGRKLAITVLTDTCPDLGACIMGFGGKAWSIHTINADGTSDKQLTKDSDSAPAWQPGVRSGAGRTPTQQAAGGAHAASSAVIGAGGEHTCAVLRAARSSTGATTASVSSVTGEHSMTGWHQHRRRSRSSV
jgi:Tol biopolymer transport system component